MSGADFGVGVWVLMALGWYVIRFPFERRAKRKAIRASARGTAERVRLAISFTGLGLLPGLFAATGFPDRFTYEPAVLQLTFGVVAAVAALALFRLTHKALGKMWSVSLDIREKHQLVTDGIYGRVRHPMYSAFWLMALAQALLIPNVVAGLAGLVGFGILFASRIGPEERMMEEAFGDEYRRYRERTKRVVPGLF